jgi:hypothetical protein
MPLWAPSGAILYTEELMLAILLLELVLSNNFYHGKTYFVDIVHTNPILVDVA